VNLSESSCLPEFYRFCLKWLKSFSLNDRQEQEWLNLNSSYGLIVGMEPRLTQATPALANALGRRRDPDVGLHIEAFYRITVNDHLDITPGIVWLTAPDHNATNDPIVLGVLRSTFRF
jgi:hypothetical protein